MPKKNAKRKLIFKGPVPKSVLYILGEDGKTPVCVPLEKADEWAKWYKQDKNKYIKTTAINDKYVVTLFLGITYLNTSRKGFSFFETAVLSSDGIPITLDNYETYDDAIKAHDEIVEKIKKEIH